MALMGHYTHPTKWRGTGNSLCIKVLNTCGKELLTNREGRFEHSVWCQEISSVFVGLYFQVSYRSQTFSTYFWIKEGYSNNNCKVCTLVLRGLF